jgi:hypothetical protein
LGAWAPVQGQGAEPSTQNFGKRIKIEKKEENVPNINENN